MTNRLSIARLLLILAPLALPRLGAQGPGTGTPGEVFLLGAIEVPGQRLPAADGLPVQVAADALRRRELRDLAAALPLMPGVTLINVGERNEALISVRGFDSRQVPLFLDGVPVYVPYDGNVDLRRFSTGDAALVSVARGFSSVLYGPNALGGAINVVSRRPQAPLEGMVSGFTGTGDLRGFDARVGGRRGAWYAQAYFGWEERDAFPLADDFRPVATEDGGDRENAFRRDEKASFKLGYAPDAFNEYAVGASIQRGEKGNPPYAGADPRQRARFWRWPQWDKTSLYYVSTTKLAGGYVKPRLYYDTFENTLDAFDNATYRTQNLGSSFRSLYDDCTWGAALEGGLAPWSGHTVKGALHFKRDVHREHNVGQAVQSMRDETASLALEDTFQLRPELSVVGGLSLERRRSTQAQDRAGAGFLNFPGNDNTSVNPQLGVFHEPAARVQWHVTVARKTRFPTLKDRYSYRLGQALPNPALRLERALHYEAGYHGPLVAGIRLRAAAFLSELDSAIIQVDDVARTEANAPLFQLRNFGRMRNRGFEVGFEQSPRTWLQWSASYTRLQRANKALPALRLTDTPAHRVVASLVVKPAAWLSIGPAFEYATDRYSTSYGVTAAGYALTHLHARADLPHGFSLSVGGTNLFDRNYALREGYPEPGREFVGRLEWRF
jgi:iron complex outermembrane receptor protein